MVKREDACIHCGLPCVDYCTYKYSYCVEYVCDKCGSSEDKLYEVEGKQLCARCALEECADEIISEYASEFANEYSDELIDEYGEKYLENMLEVVTDD